jgi:hypothetical protein
MLRHAPEMAGVYSGRRRCRLSFTHLHARDIGDTMYELASASTRA